MFATRVQSSDPGASSFHSGEECQEISDDKHYRRVLKIPGQVGLLALHDVSRGSAPSRDRDMSSSILGVELREIPVKLGAG